MWVKEGGLPVSHPGEGHGGGGVGDVGYADYASAKTITDLQISCVN